MVIVALYSTRMPRVRIKLHAKLCSIPWHPSTIIVRQGYVRVGSDQSKASRRPAIRTQVRTGIAFITIT